LLAATATAVVEGYYGGNDIISVELKNRLHRGEGTLHASKMISPNRRHFVG